MPKLPDIRGRDRLKPLCYDPKEDRFITLDDLVEGRAKVVPLRLLDDEQTRQLVIERIRVGEDYTVQAISGPARTRDRVIQEIESGTDFGRRAVMAEIMYLEDLLKQIEAAIKKK